MAFSIDFISELISRVADLGKGEVRTSFLKSKEKQKPNYTSNYVYKVEMMERIKYHAELNNFPEKLFIAKAPRQTAEELEYIRANYKQVTLPVYLDFQSTISRIFHDTNYSISYPHQESIEGEYSYQEYIEEGLPYYGSLEAFMKFMIPHLKLTDPNGIIAVKPYEINKFENDNGEILVDDSKLFEPTPFYFSCEQIVAEEEDEYYLVELKDKSPVNYYDKIQNIGRVFEFYDKENIYRIYQVGKYTDNEFVIELYFNHGEGIVPCTKLKGIPSLVQSELVWISPFSYAVDLLDLVAVNSSYLQVVINNCVFPFRVMYGDICEFEYIDRMGERSVCSNGQVYDSSGQRYITCSACNGSGLKSRVSPLGVMLLKPKTNTSEGDSGLAQNPIQYVEPTMNTPEFLMKKIDNDELKARKILHLHTSTSSVTGNEKLATDMMLDLKALYAFIKPISDQIFSIWEFIAKRIGYQRYNELFNAPVFTYPISFDFNTEQDYTIQISEAIKAGLPPFILQTILWKYLQAIYYNEKTTSQVFNLIYNTDRLLPFTNDDILLKQSKGLVQKWEIILHDSALTFVDELKKEVEGFFDLSLDEQKQMLIDKAKKVVDNIEGKVISTQMNVVSNIMQTSSAKAEQQMSMASEEELKAQAMLKGSVGGVQGILELQKSVASGATDKAAAIAILELVYGFTNQEATDIIGNPKQVIPITPLPKV